MRRSGRLTFSALAATLVAGASTFVTSTSVANVAGASQSGAGDCIAHRFIYHEPDPIWYTSGCSGHDEPELDPVSSLAGSAQDLTWTAVLPSDGVVPVSAVGPTFW